MSASYQTVVSGQGGCCRPHAESDPGLGRGARAHPGRVPGRTWDAKPGDGVSGRGPCPQRRRRGRQTWCAAGGGRSPSCRCGGCRQPPRKGSRSRPGRRAAERPAPMRVGAGTRRVAWPQRFRGRCLWVCRGSLRGSVSPLWERETEHSLPDVGLAAAENLAALLSPQLRC